jgi:hypothetical protein
MLPASCACTARDWELALCTVDTRAEASAAFATVYKHVQCKVRGLSHWISHQMQCFVSSAIPLMPFRRINYIYSADGITCGCSAPDGRRAEAPIRHTTTATANTSGWLRVIAMAAYARIQPLTVVANPQATRSTKPSGGDSGIGGLADCRCERPHVEAMGRNESVESSRLTTGQGLWLLAMAKS